MSLGKSTPVISLSSETELGISVSEVTSFTKHFLESKELFFVELRRALEEKEFNLKEVCIIWMIPINIDAEACTIFINSGLLYDFGPKGISGWKDRTKEPESNEYIQLGKQYFDQNGS